MLDSPRINGNEASTAGSNRTMQPEGPQLEPISTAQMLGPLELPTWSRPKNLALVATTEQPSTEAADSPLLPVTQRAKVWCAVLCNKLAPLFLRGVTQKLAASDAAQIELIRKRATANPAAALKLVEDFGLTDCNAIVRIAEPLAKKGPEEALTLIKQQNIADPEIVRRVMSLCTNYHPRQTLSAWGRFGLTDATSQREYFRVALALDPEAALDALDLIPINSPAIRQELRLQAARVAPALVLDRLRTATAEDCHSVVLAVLQINRILVLDRLTELPIAEPYRYDLLKETAFHNPEMVIERVNPELVPDEETRKTLAILCGFRNPKQTAAKLASFQIENPDYQQEVALHLAAQDGAAMAAALPVFTNLSPTHLTRVVLRCLSTSWWGAVPHLGGLPLPEGVRNQISAESSDRDPVRAFHHLQILAPSDQAIVRAIALNAAREDSSAALESYSRKLNLPYPIRLEFARHCAPRDPAALARRLAALDLERPADHDQLVVVCLENDFWGTVDNIRCFEIPEERRNSILRQAMSRDLSRTVGVLADLGATAVNELRQVVTAYARSRPVEASQNRALWNAVPSELRAEAALIAATINARAVCQGIQNYQIPDPEQRGRIFASCLERNPRETVSAAPLFDLPQSILENFAEQLLRSPSVERDLEILAALDIPKGSALYVEAARQAVGQSAKWLAENIGRYGISDQTELNELAFRCAARNPSALLSNIKRFKLLPEVLFELIGECSGGDPKRAISLYRKLQIPYSERQGEIALCCARRNIERAYAWAEERMGEENPLRSNETLQQLFKNALQNGRIHQLLKISEHQLKIQNIHPTAGATLEQFDSTLQTIAGQDELDGTSRRTVKLLQAIRQSGAAPTQSILKTLRHFGLPEQHFLVGILQQAGPSFGESVLETLRSTHAKGAEISREDKAILHDVIGKGFRGFSPGRFHKLREAYQQSRHAGRQLLEAWSNVSRSVLTGISVAREIRTSNEYVDYVIQAYRPTGMSRSEVKHFLETVPDHSDRLERFQYPMDGYDMSLVSIENVHVKAGQTLNHEALAELGRAVQQAADTPTDTREFLMMLTRAAQRAGSQIDKVKFLAYITRQPAAAGFAERLNRISAELIQADYSDKRAYQVLSDLQECLTSLLEASLNVIVPPLVGEPGADRDQLFVPSTKLCRSICRALNLPTDQDLQKADIAYALVQELGKTFRDENKLAAGELSKIDTGAGEAAGSFGMYLALNQAAFLGRAGAGLCTASDLGSWNDRSFLQMIMVDKGRGRIVGNIQLHLFTNQHGQASVLARINPTAAFVTKVDRDILAREMLRVIQTFAKENRLLAYLPEQTDWHNLTNRNTFAPSLKVYCGPRERTSVRITRWHSVDTLYRMLDVEELNVQAI